MKTLIFRNPRGAQAQNRSQNACKTLIFRNPRGTQEVNAGFDPGLGKSGLAERGEDLKDHKNRSKHRKNQKYMNLL